ncbi:zinc ribbon domain-containing protein [Micromonospora sp. NPDC003776]
MGATLNTRLSQQVRGKIIDRVRHLAAETGIAVVGVPARDTSKHCPQCLTPLRHRKAPDQPTTPGWKWAICPHQSCGWQGDRDHGAWRRIAARGLTHQAKTVTDRSSGAMVIRAGFLAGLGLPTAAHPSGMGEHVPADASGRTAEPGVWVAGNVTDPSAQVGAAAAAGTWVAAQINADLVAEEARGAVAARREPFSPAIEARVGELVAGDRRHGL